MVKKSSNFIRAHKKLVIISGILALVFALIVGRIVYDNIVVSDMRNIANQVIVPGEWSLTSEHHMAPLILCMADEPCPHYVKSWKVSGLVTDKVLDNIVGSSKLPVSESTYCMKLGETEYISTCTKTSYYHNFKVSIFYTLDSTDTKTGRAQIDISR